MRVFPHPGVTFVFFHTEMLSDMCQSERIVFSGFGQTIRCTFRPVFRPLLCSFTEVLVSLCFCWAAAGVSGVCVFAQEEGMEEREMLSPLPSSLCSDPCLSHLTCIKSPVIVATVVTLTPGARHCHHCTYGPVNHTHREINRENCEGRD